MINSSLTGDQDRKLTPCPFCGDDPSFSSVEEKSDRRYMQMDLHCCITMSSSIGYGEFRLMSEIDIEKQLRATLVKKWNSRAAVPESPILAPERIEELALANGFKLKEQPNGEMALNPYVFDFALAIGVETLASLVDADAEGSRLITRLMTEVNDLRDATSKKSLRQAAHGDDSMFIGNVVLRAASEYHEDYGDVLWFHFHNFEEPPETYVGSTLDLSPEFDEDHWTHFTQINFNSVIEQAIPVNEAIAECEAFNNICPVGGSVRVLVDGSDKPVYTKTSTEAQVLGGHSAVVWLMGVRGCYLLSRVTPIELTKADNFDVPELDPKDLSVNEYGADFSGFVVKPPSGITITHNPTGLSASDNSGRSKHQNKTTAYCALCVKVAEHYAAGRG